MPFRKKQTATNITQTPTLSIGSYDEKELPSLPAAELSPSQTQHNHAQQVSASSEQVKFKPGRSFWIAYFGFLILNFTVTLDTTAIPFALPRITAGLHGTAVEGFWAGTSFLLTSTVFQPIFGVFSSIFGRKPMIELSLVLFALGAVLNGADREGMTQLLVGRSIQGIGAGGILVMTEVTVTDLVPLRLRGKFLSMIAAVLSLGSVAGPLVGGALASHWQWIFWLELPLIAVAVVPVTFFLRLKFKATSLGHKLARVDWAGSTMFVASTTGFLIPVTWGGTQEPWNSWRTLVPLLLGAAGLVGFLVWETKVASNPLIRVSVLKGRNNAVTFFGSLMQCLVLYFSVYFSPIYFQAVKLRSPVISGVFVFPMTFTVAPVAMICGGLVAKLGTYRWCVWLGWALTTLGMGIRILLDVHTQAQQWVFINMVAGIGIGMLYPGLLFAMQAAMKDEDVSYGVSLFTFLRAAGQMLGVAIGGTTLQNALKKQILRHPSIAANAETYSKQAYALVTLVKELPDGAMRDDLVQAFADALKTVWMVACIIAAVGLITSAATKEYSLDRQHVSEQGMREETSNEQTRHDRV